MLLLHLAAMVCATPRAVAKNVVIVIADGLRREEVFGGAQEDLLASTNAQTRTAYWDSSVAARRRRLMPFFWSRVAAEGQVLGDQSIGSICEVTNGLNFSYPGYSETLCGFADSRVVSNNRIPNPNVTVLEWLSRQASIHGQVAAFGAWDVISSIINKRRCGFTDVAAYEQVEGCKLTSTQKVLNRMKVQDRRIWPQETSDKVAFDTALEYVKANHPRVLFISLGETDKWAHEREYGHYLGAAHDFDEDVEKLWTTLQAMPQYSGSTTLILTCDHGRGTGADWTSHGKRFPNSRYTWMAFLGPGTRPLGDVPKTCATNGQIASTAAAALGYDYAWAQPRSAPPIPSVLR